MSARALFPPLISKERSGGELSQRQRGTIIGALQ